MTARKDCTKCGVSQPLEDFPPRKRRKDGRCSHCRACTRAKANKWHHENIERANATSRSWHSRNREEANAGRMERHREAMQEPTYRARHNASSSNWRKNNPELAAQYSKEWTRNNPDKNCARANRYRAARINATPAWADPREILALYELSDRMSTSTGIRHHVDHIVPLKGRMVCGLHVHWNLRVIPAKDNLSKGAKLIEELAIA